MAYILTGICFIVLTALIANYLTLPFIGFMICWSGFITMVGVVIEFRGGN
jgi:hypothetical protein